MADPQLTVAERPAAGQEDRGRGGGGATTTMRWRIEPALTHSFVCTCFVNKTCTQERVYMYI
jgi:hypothetical protein